MIGYCNVRIEFGRHSGVIAVYNRGFEQRIISSSMTNDNSSCRLWSNHHESSPFSGLSAVGDDDDLK